VETRPYVCACAVNFSAVNPVRCPSFFKTIPHEWSFFLGLTSTTKYDTVVGFVEADFCETVHRNGATMRARFIHQSTPIKEVAVGMPHEPAWPLDQEMNALADEQVRYADQVLRCKQQFERIGKWTVELLVKRLPCVPKSCFLSQDHFMVAGGAPGEGIDPEYVLPLVPFLANSSYPRLGFALGAKGNGFVAIEDNEGALVVSPCLAEPQPIALDLDIRKLQEYIAAKVKAEEDTKEIPLSPPPVP